MQILKTMKIRAYLTRVMVKVRTFKEEGFLLSHLKLQIHSCNAIKDLFRSLSRH
jgi:hypothetical protein